MNFVSIDETEYKKLNEYSIKYNFLMKYLMSKLEYNYACKWVQFDYKFPNDDFIEMLKALEKEFNYKVYEIEKEAIKQEGDKDEDRN